MVKRVVSIAMAMRMAFLVPTILIMCIFLGTKLCFPTWFSFEIPHTEKTIDLSSPYLILHHKVLLYGGK
jgi:hypothetical protein